VNLVSGNTAIATVTPSVFIAAGATTPATQPQITGVALGLADITASDSNPNVGERFAQDTQSVSVRLTLNFSPSSVTVLTENTANITLNLSAPAPSGGVTITLRTDDTARATVPPTVTFVAGQSSVPVTVTGVSVGTTTLRASGTNINEVTANVTVTPAPAITLGDVTVGKNLQTTTAGTLAAPAPAGNLNVTITSADPARALLSTSASVAGSASITVQVPAGSTGIPTFHVHALDGSGAVQLRATAPGYASGTGAATLQPSGFFIEDVDFTTTSSSPNTPVKVGVAMLTPGSLTIQNTLQGIRAGLSVNVPVTSSNTSVGTITISPLAFSGGETRETTAFDPVGGGTTDIRVAQPSGFSAPAAQTQITATVTAPAITLADVTVGKNLQTTIAGTLAAPAPAGNLNVTITSADPARALLSTSASVAGSASITVQVAAGSTGIPTFHVHALEGSGAVQLTAAAPGYTSGASTITLNPSGFMLNKRHPSEGCFTCTDALETTTGSPNSPLYVISIVLDPGTLQYQGYQPVRAGLGSVRVDVTSGDPSIGTITTSPVVFGAGEHLQTTGFDPVAGGSTVLGINTPGGFSTASNFQQLTANVIAINSLFLPDLTIGKDLQQPSVASLSAPAPAGNLQVTITSADSTRALLSTSPTVAGSASITLTVFAGDSVTPQFYVYALAGSGTVQYTASAPGHNSSTGTITLHPSGFILSNLHPFADCFLCYSSFDTTPYSPETAMYVVSARLDPTTLAYAAYQPLRAGLGSVNVDVSSNSPSVGTITTSPVVFGADTFVLNTYFHPLSVGSSLLTVSTPGGFTTPSDHQQFTANVIPPEISLPDLTIGKNLQVGTYAPLGAPAPPGGVEVTITVADTSKALLSSDPSAAGSASLTYAIPEGGSSTPEFYVQALQDSGTVQYTASAAGFASATKIVTLIPSGFVLSQRRPFDPCFTCADPLETATSSPDAALYLVAAALDSTTLNYSTYQGVRGGLGPVSVSVTSSNTSVGAVTSSPVVFDANASFLNTYFDPLTIGSTVLNIGTPGGFNTPSNLQQLTANVTRADVYLNDLTIGKDLQSPSQVTLSVAAPAGGVEVTVTVADTGKALLSTDAVTAGIGTGTLTFVIPEGGASTPEFYVQALAGSGSVQYTASATGQYNARTSVITLVPSGFVIPGIGPSFTTTLSSSDTTLIVSPAALDPVTLNYAGTQQLRPGMTNTNVFVRTDPNPSPAGQITLSPLVFNGGDDPNFRTTSFHPTAVGSTVIRVTAPGFSTASNNNNVTANVTGP
jgi:hypothetical protein